jgi:nitroimidazol reductase NimA-like FMN-containing flavoprotein (pyridoxamine 5'-phosphate oxidase superfamily)
VAAKPNDVPPRVRVRRGPKKGRYDRESIDAVLDRGLLAHVAFADGDGAVCIPMLYARVGDTVYIHGSTASRAVRLLAVGAPACVTVTLVHALVLARSAFEHSANYDSVMVFGRFELVEDEAERLRAFEAFTEKLLPGRWDEARRPNAKELKATSILASRSATPRSRCAAGRRTTTTRRTPSATRGPGSFRSSGRMARRRLRPGSGRGSRFPRASGAYWLFELLLDDRRRVVDADQVEASRPEVHELAACRDRRRGCRRRRPPGPARPQ